MANWANSEPAPLIPNHKRFRYFALVVRVPIEALDDNTTFTAATDLANMTQKAAPSFLPHGTRITRSIELTEETARNGIR